VPGPHRPAFADEAKPAPRYDPTDAYVARRIEGWRVLVNSALLAKEHNSVRKETLKLLGDHLYRTARVVPAGPLAKCARCRSGLS
jgi:hypothetical protein